MRERLPGPALAGALIAVAGVGAAFLVNVFSFVGVILVVASWKRPVKARTAPAETLKGGTVTALRYVANAPVTRAAILRAGVVMFCASAPFALLPTVAHAISECDRVWRSARSFCCGRDRGSPRDAARQSTMVKRDGRVGRDRYPGRDDRGDSPIHVLSGVALVMFVSGGAWLTFISLANAFVQTVAPDWVRARVLAVFMLITQGGLAAGSVVWGAIASRASVDPALMCAGLATLAAISLGFVARLPDQILDLSPWNHVANPSSGT